MHLQAFSEWARRTPRGCQISMHVRRFCVCVFERFLEKNPNKSQISVWKDPSSTDFYMFFDAFVFFKLYDVESSAASPKWHGTSVLMTYQVWLKTHQSMWEVSFFPKLDTKWSTERGTVSDPPLKETAGSVREVKSRQYILCEGRAPRIKPTLPTTVCCCPI